MRLNRKPPLCAAASIATTAHNSRCHLRRVGSSGLIWWPSGDLICPNQVSRPQQRLAIDIDCLQKLSLRLHGPHVARTIPVSTTSTILILFVLFCAPGHVASNSGMISSHVCRATGITRSVPPPNHSNTAGALAVQYLGTRGSLLGGTNETPLTDYLHFRPLPGLS